MKSYPKISQSYKIEAEGIYVGHVDVEEKIDGCFQYNMRVRLADGKTEHIGKIVKNKLPVWVLSYNEKTKKVEPKKVVKWFNNGKSNEWLYVKCKGKTISIPTMLKVTKNHMIYTKNKDGNIKKIRVDEINVGDIIMKPDYNIDYIQKQVIYGTLLGDASISLTTEKGNPRISVGHSKKQLDYLLLKEKILSNFSPRKDEVTSGYGSKMIRIVTNTIPSFTTIYAKCIINGKKTVTVDWIKELGIIGMAFWYMDDGSISLSTTQRPRVNFATNSFSTKECELLVNNFKNMGYDVSICNDGGKGNKLTMNADSSERFLREISFFVPKSMEYKLPPYCRNESSFWDKFDFSKLKGMSLVESNVLDIQHVKENREKFDIEVEDNHNYFVGNTLVSNSQIRIKITPTGDIICGSHNSKGDTPPDGMFNLGIEMAESIFAGYKPEFETTVFCEYLSKPKQNTIPYGRVPKRNLMLFDVQVDTLFLNRVDKEKFAADHDMEITPLLFSGDASEISKDDKILPEKEKEFLAKTSILGHAEKGFQTIEGFVIKNYDKLYDVERFRNYEESTHPWMCIKIVNEKFKEVNHEENPNRTNKFQELKDNHRTEARCMKTINSLNEQGLLMGELSDLKLLVPAMIKDIIDEEQVGIMDALWRMFGKEITGYASKEMIPTYKKYLDENS